MRRLALAIFLFASLALSLADPARAQYMYLDANGDGLNTAADTMPALGTPTTVDIWIDTDSNRGGTPATCPTGDGALTINSYVVNIRAINGTVSFQNFINRFSTASVVLVPFTTSSTEMTVGWGGASFSPPGTYRLATVTVTPLTSTPALEIVRSSGLQAFDVTCFGSQCSGNDFDNTLKLGTDWFDVDGIRQPGAPNVPPTISAPQNVFGNTNVSMTITGSASDPDAGNVVTLSQTNNAPFLSGPASAGPAPAVSITLSGTPSSTGSFSIQWSAADGLGATAGATTSIQVSVVDTAPVINVAPTRNGTPGVLLEVNALGTDADSHPLFLSQTNDAPFFPPSSSIGPIANPSLTISGTPSATQVGNYTIHWTATENAGQFLSATATTAVSIAVRPPVIVAPATVSGTVGSPISITANSADPDGQTVTLCVLGAPPFLTGPSCVGPVMSASLTRAGTPGPGDVGSYTMTWTSTDGMASASATTALTIGGGNRCPTANAGGPYTGVRFGAVTFNGTGSSDPDGNALTYSWDFGDGSTGSGAIVSHIYTAAGTYGVVLVVNDGICTGAATTTATISGEYPSYAFTTGGNGTVSLGSGKPYNCVQIQPFGGAFEITNVNTSTIKMLSPGTGSVSEIAAVFSKTTAGGDKNGDGIAEIQVCFAKSDLRLLFSNLPSGRNTIDVSITGQLTTGGAFLAPLRLVVKATGGALAASISPNPLNPRAKLTFATSKPGGLRVQMFDLSGRLVRKIADEVNAASGYHDFTIDGRDASGGRLASGIYFVKIWTENDGSLVKNLTILK